MIQDHVNDQINLNEQAEYMVIETDSESHVVDQRQGKVFQDKQLAVVVRIGDQVYLVFKRVVKEEEI